MNGISIVILGAIITAWCLLSESPETLDRIIDTLKGGTK